ncbi:heavy-metal-associated domain-containing protein [Nocardia sp. NPDC057353]|uniref:heavy-metal-associated domain-containing protein n=1 Tax=Nocardia sp. NPDC057353 TaxID=3346104 RepID=UPI003636862E
MATTTVTVSGMSCGGCASKVRTAIGELPGVSEVQADPGTGAVVVTAQDPITPAAIAEVVEPIGYQVSA